MYTFAQTHTHRVRRQPLPHTSNCVHFCSDSHTKSEHTVPPTHRQLCTLLLRLTHKNWAYGSSSTLGIRVWCDGAHMAQYSNTHTHTRPHTAQHTHVHVPESIGVKVHRPLRHIRHAVQYDALDVSHHLHTVQQRQGARYDHLLAQPAIHTWTFRSGQNRIWDSCILVYIR